MNQKSHKVLYHQYLEVGLFRIAFGLYLLYYNSLLLPKLSLYFGPESIIHPLLLPPFFNSPSFSFLWNTPTVTVLFVLMFLMIICFTLGLLNKASLIPLIILQLFFYHSNPLILHEPQPLANLFLFWFLFLPPNTAPSILKNSLSLNDQQQLDIKHILRILIAFFGIYYMIVGCKKLPDPLWLKGEALKHLISWPAVSRDNFLTHLFVITPGVAMLLTYATLIFEIGFIFIVFTRYRFVLIPLGLVLHGGIYLTMEVGSLSQILVVWYALLLDHSTRQRLLNMCSFKRS